MKETIKEFDQERLGKIWLGRRWFPNWSDHQRKGITEIKFALDF